MNREEIMGTSRVMLVAGAETTATLLGGATYILLQNPSMMHRAQSEVRGTFKKADDITLRAVSTPGLLPYLDAVLQESLRCRPPVPAAFPRKVGPSGAIIEGRFVPANVFESPPVPFQSPFPSQRRTLMGTLISRQPWASINGLPTAAAPISPLPMHSTLSASFRLRPRITVTTTSPPCNLSRWVLEGA